MSPAQAVELAYRIGEHWKATRLLEALNDARDCTLFAGQGDEAQLAVLTNAGLVHIPAPMMLVRHMFQRGILRAEVRSYRDQLGESIAEEFGIIIEDEPPQQHQGSKAE